MSAGCGSSSRATFRSSLRVHLWRPLLGVAQPGCGQVGLLLCVPAALPASCLCHRVLRLGSSVGCLCERMLNGWWVAVRCILCGPSLGCAWRRFLWLPDELGSGVSGPLCPLWCVAKCGSVWQGLGVQEVRLWCCKGCWCVCAGCGLTTVTAAVACLGCVFCPAVRLLACWFGGVCKGCGVGRGTAWGVAAGRASCAAELAWARRRRVVR